MAACNNLWNDDKKKNRIERSPDERFASRANELVGMSRKARGERAAPSVGFRGIPTNVRGAGAFPFCQGVA